MLCISSFAIGIYVVPPGTRDRLTGDTEHSMHPRKEAGGFNQGNNYLRTPQTKGCGGARAAAARVGEANKNE